MQQSWDDLLLAFLHDPPDKALDVRGHVERACRYASVAVGRTVSAGALAGISDQLASVMERVPLPTVIDHESMVPDGRRAVGPRHDRLTIFHPLSGERSTLAVGQVDEAAVHAVMTEIVRGLDSPRDRFLAVWRLLPERLAADRPWTALLPADARLPDHTIWHHLDASAALRAAHAGQHGAALLRFALGPAQPTVKAAQSVDDLQLENAIISWLTFQAMLPIVEQLGPTAVIYPSLRGDPLLDDWLRRHTAVGGKLGDCPNFRRGPTATDGVSQTGENGTVPLTACLPSRFLAVVPWGAKGETAHELAGLCEAAARRGQMTLANSPPDALASFFGPIAVGWDKRWQELTVRHLFHSAALPLGGGESAKRGGEEVEQAIAALWDKARFAEAYPHAASVRKLVDAIPDDECPKHLQRSNPVRANLSGLWQAQVEISAWLIERQRNVGTKKGTSLFDRRASQVSRGPEGELHESETFPFLSRMGSFAVLAMDGDDVRGWLQGEKSPAVRDVLHPDLRDYFARLPDTAPGLSAPRPVGPALHAAISHAQSNFALRIAPPIVEKHSGILIYCTGDELLAVLPPSAAMPCAHELRLAYCGDPRVNGGARSGYFHHDGQDLLTMGSRATASAGLAVAACERDLGFALSAAREALKAAKEAGRDVLQVVACLGCGEPSAAFCPWEFTDAVQAWAKAFSAGASNRWTCRLSAELPTLKTLGPDAVRAEIRRLTGKAGGATRGGLPPDSAAVAFDAYCMAMQDRRLATAPESFITLCQTASLLASGRVRQTSAASAVPADAVIGGTALRLSHPTTSRGQAVILKASPNSYPTTACPPAPTTASAAGVGLNEEYETMSDAVRNGRVAALLFLHAQTAVHPGSGAALGAVDLPVQRERHTQWPIIPGSSLKGALRNCCRQQVASRQGREADADPDLAATFGSPAADTNRQAGALSVTDARILAFPVRSLRGVFAWVTCPAALERLGRDLQTVGWDKRTGPAAAQRSPVETVRVGPPTTGDLGPAYGLSADQAACAEDSPLLVEGNKLVLEEFEFTRVADARETADWFAAHAVNDPATQSRVKSHLVVLCDDDFTHFVRHATEVVARVGLDRERKTIKAGAVLYQEFLPAETLFCSLVFAGDSRRDDDARTAPEVLAYLQRNLDTAGGLQVGGDETTGKGICLVRLCQERDA